MSSISEEEDSGPSLKELVTKNLENNGILGKLQAQLRASIFLILEEEFQEKNIPLTNKKAHDLLATPVGKIAITIVQDLLQCLNLDFTLTVFCPETKSVLSEHSANREALNKELGSCSYNIPESYPFLFKLIEELQLIHKVCDNNEKKTIPPRNPPSYDKATSFNAKQNIISGKNDPLFSQGSAKESSHTSTTSHTENNSTKDDISEELTSSSKISPDLGSENKKILKDSHKDLSTSQSSNKSTNASSSTSKSSTLKNSSSRAKSSLSNGDSSHSSRTSSSSLKKGSLSGIEKEYEEESFSSISEPKTLENSSVKSSHQEKSICQENSSGQEKSKKIEEKTKVKEEEEKSEIEEAVETAEDIEEDITSIDDLLSSNSEISNRTKDVTASNENSVADYQENL